MVFLRLCRQGAKLGVPLRYYSVGSSAQAEGPPVTATNRVETSLKRFWKTVGIEQRNNDLAITLDKRALKTPSGNPVVIPSKKRLLATLIANEWENQKKVIKPHALPLTSLASRAIDGLGDDSTRIAVRDALLKYLDTDTICFHETHPPALVDLQSQHWDPLLEWARKEFAADIRTFDSLLINSQSKETKGIFSDVLSEFDQWQMAAMERAVYSTKSFIIALALIRRKLNTEEAALASHVEVTSQIKTWGEVEDTHDVDHRDVRRQLGSVSIMLHDS